MTIFRSTANRPRIPASRRPRAPCWVACGAALALLILPGAAVAWNATGHRLVAEIAWQQMTDAARDEAGKLLQAHPDAERWRARAKADTPRALFIEASTWPDEIRKDARFYTPGKDEPTPLRPGFPDMERHSNWHTAPRPIDGSHPPEDFKPGQLDSQLIRQLAVLDGASSPRESRAYALPWVIHLLGDAHQPLHLSLRRSAHDAQGEWDRVGHAVTVSNPFNPRKKQSTLHEFWDGLPISPSLRGERLAAEAQALMAEHPKPANNAPPEEWLEESWRLARDRAYPPDGALPVMISRDFYERSKRIAEQRLVAAGYRLAARLNRALAQ